MSARNINNFDMTVQSWYVLLRSSQVKPNKVKAVSVLNRKIAVFRDQQGYVHAIDARCPHMGSDLSLGTVVGCNLRCPLHKWQLNENGVVVDAPHESVLPQRRIRAYPMMEKYGYIWMFNGPKPLFGVPEVNIDNFYVLRLPSQIFKNHPHFLTANGLDWRHLDTLHDMELKQRSQCQREGNYEVVVRHSMRPKSAVLKFLTGLRRKYINASFRTIGPNTAIIGVGKPVILFLMFSSVPNNNRTTRTRATLFLPKKNIYKLVHALWLYCIMTIFVLLYKDHKIFNSTNFIPGFTDVDDAFKMYTEMVDTLPTY